MRSFCIIGLGVVLLVSGLPASGQVMSGLKPKKGEVRWVNTYFGFNPKAWFEERAPLTAQLLATAPTSHPDSLALVLLPNYRIQFPSGKQYLRAHLLNPTAHAVTVERADATLLNVQVELRLEGRWVLPSYPPDTYCGNSFWQDTLAANSSLTMQLDGEDFYRGTVPVEGRIVARVGQAVVRSAAFTAQLTPLQLYYLRYPRVPFPDIN